MNRPLLLHGFSVSLGIGIAALFIVTTSQLAPITPEKISRVQYFAHPRDMVQIHEPTAFRVPPGKLLVITALGAQYAGACGLRADGEVVTYVGGGIHGLIPVAIPKAFPAETFVEVFSNHAFPGEGRAWGYLEDAVAPASNVLRVRYAPHPSQIVELRPGTPFTVPSGQLFVLTGMGRAETGNTQIMINGSTEYAGLNYVDQGATWNVPTGLTALSGDVVEVVSMSFDGRGFVLGTGGLAWGYVEDE